MFLMNLQILHPDSKGQPLFCISSKRGNASDVQGLFDRIVTQVKTQIHVPLLSLDSDPSYNFRVRLCGAGGGELIGRSVRHEGNTKTF
jgi:hypothetical protein